MAQPLVPAARRKRRRSKTVARSSIRWIEKEALVYRLMPQNLLPGEALHLVRKDQPLVGRAHIEVRLERSAVARRLVVNRRDADVLRKIAPAAPFQLLDDGFQAQAGIEHVVYQEQPVFGVELRD